MAALPKAYSLGRKSAPSAAELDHAASSPPAAARARKSGGIDWEQELKSLGGQQVISRLRPPLPAAGVPIRMRCSSRHALNLHLVLLPASQVKLQPSEKAADSTAWWQHLDSGSMNVRPDEAQFKHNHGGYKPQNYVAGQRLQYHMEPATQDQEAH